MCAGYDGVYSSWGNLERMTGRYNPVTLTNVTSRTTFSSFWQGKSLSGFTYRKAVTNQPAADLWSSIRFRVASPRSHLDVVGMS